MAKRDSLGKQRYWFEGVPSTLLKAIIGANFGTQTYWYNGSPQGFLVTSTIIPKPRNFSVLIGF
jgi:hypothetical protein